jgi:hypothetical protein
LRNKKNRICTCTYCGYEHQGDFEICSQCETAKETPQEKEIDKIFKALSNPKRRILLKEILSKPRSRRELSRAIGVSIEMTKRHCNHFLRMGVMTEEPAKNEDRGGYLTKYNINAERLRNILRELNEYMVFQSLKSEGTKKKETYDYDIETKKVKDFASELSQNIDDRSWLVIDSGDYDGKAFMIQKFPVKIGRDNMACEIKIPFDEFVSNPHAEIRTDSDNKKYFLKDLTSLNHTIFKDKTLIDEEVEISNGERFKIGKTWIKLKIKEVR